MALIKKITEISKSDTLIAGGKGASLGEMTRAGILVPPGFVILSDAFDKFMEETDLNVEIDAILKGVNIKIVHTVENASEKIQSMILSKGIPWNIKEEILKYYKKLNTKFVAVRSSATAEDSASAAWAGQLDSFLNTTKENLLENVKKCWASLFTPRAIFYRFEKKLSKNKISVAVVVQTMVASEQSGIAFSVHPVTQDENQIIIEAGFGLGEAIVSGAITPDSYFVDKQSFKILDINVTEQSQGLYGKNKGGNEWKDLEEKGKEQVLSKKEIVGLSKLIVKIENHYGFPCDIEWAKENGKFYVVQSRPITTIGNLENEKFADKFIKSIKNQELYPQVSNVTNFTPRISGYCFAGFYKDTTPTPYITIMKEGHDSFVFVPETKFKNTAKEIFNKYWQNPKFIDNHIKKINECIKSISNIYLFYNYKKIVNMPVGKLLKVAEKAINTNRQLNTLIWFVIYFDRELCSGLLKDNHINISKNRLEEIWEKGTVPFFSSFEKVRQLNVLQLINKQMNWRDIAERCQFYFANYNSIANLEFSKRELQKQYGRYSLKEARDLLKKESEDKIIKYKDYKKWFKTLSRNEKKLVIYLQNIIKIRDIRKDAVSQALAIVYRISERVFDKAKIDKKLIKYCAGDEILRGLEYLKDNKRNLEKRRSGISMMFFVDSDKPAEFEYGTYEETKTKLEKYYRDKQSTVAINQNEIRGQIACPGKVIGIVKVVNDIKKIKNFKKGNILVTSMTRPEFVPLMKKAGAIITDEGGITSHAAIVSRELNIPCVIGTKFATHILNNGDIVEVDADKGCVKIVRKANSALMFEKSTNYVRMFESTGMPFLINSVTFEHYKPFKAVAIFKDNLWTSFLPKSTLKETLKEGVELFGSKAIFKEYVNEFENYKVDSEKYFQEIISKPKISLIESRKFFYLISKFWLYYKKTEFFYVDEAYQQSKKDKIISKNLKHLEKIKNSGRGLLNKMIFGSSSYIYKALEILSKNFKISVNDLFLYSKEEIFGLYDNKKLEKKLLDDRKKSYVFLVRENELINFSGDVAKDYISKFLIIHKSGKEIKGIIANPGKVRGRAKVLFYGSDTFDKISTMIDKMKEGDILITETTSPEIMKACKKASAILTNQGGLLSHAAIISRELNIPCIVGLGNITKIVKDGDMLEVNANNGYVKILNT